MHHIGSRVCELGFAVFVHDEELELGRREHPQVHGLGSCSLNSLNNEVT